MIHSGSGSAEIFRYVINAYINFILVIGILLFLYTYETAAVKADLIDYFDVAMFIYERHMTEADS